MREAYKPSSVIGGHLSRPVVTSGFKRNPESLTGRLKRSFVSCSEWGLHGSCVTTVPCELLPHNFNLTTALPVSAECFCCTFPIVTYARRYLASSPYGARTFLISFDTRLSGLPITIYFSIENSIILPFFTKLFKRININDRF